MASGAAVKALPVAPPQSSGLPCIHARIPLILDGIPFTAHRFSPPNGATDPVPAVIVSSFGCNGQLARAGYAGRSLVSRLCGRGRTVWSFDLRGQEPHYDAASRRALRNGHGSPTIGDFAAHELAIVVRRALADATGASHVDVLGLSMGGAIAAAFAAFVAPAQVRRLALVGTPLHWHRIPWWAIPLTRVPRLATVLPTDQLHHPIRWLARYLDCVPRAVLPRWLDNPDASAHIALGASVGPFAPAITHAAAAWVCDGVVIEGQRLWDHLPAIQATTLCVCSDADRFAPPANVLPALRRFGTPDDQRHAVVVARASHLELFVGRRADAEVHPRVVEFMSESSGQHSLAWHTILC